MATFRRLIYLFVPASFLIGLWFGLRSLTVAPSDAGRYDRKLRVLSLSGVLQRSWIQRFQMMNQVQIELQEAGSPEELLIYLHDPNLSWDVVSVFSFQIDPASIPESFQKLSEEHISLPGTIGADFVGTRLDPNGEYLVPFFWSFHGLWIHKDKKELGTWSEVQNLFSEKQPVPVEANARELIGILLRTGEIQLEWLTAEQADLVREKLRRLLPKIHSAFPLTADELQISDAGYALGSYSSYLRLDETIRSDWKFTLLDQANSIWFYYMAVASESQEPDLSQRFLQFLLKQDYLKKVVTEKHWATTVPLLDDSEIPRELRARHLREMPLRKMEFISALPPNPVLWQQILSSLRNDLIEEEP